MTLGLIELNSDNLKQEVRSTRAQHIAHIRPHVLKFDSPSGSIAMQIQDVNGKIIATSNFLTGAQISSATYFHGYIRFDINASLSSDTVYNISMRSTGGYSFAEANYFGWILEHNDFRKYQPKTGIDIDGMSSALDFEVWERKLVTKGQS